MEFIIAIPVFVLSAMLQSTSISRLPLIHGTADLSLLVLIAWGIHSRSNLTWVLALVAGIIISFYSQVTWLTMVIPYFFIVLITRLLHGIFWNSPLLAMLMMSVIGSMLVHLATLLSLFFKEISFNFSQAFSEIILPSVFINLLLALPVLFLVKDLLRWIHPQVENE
jgi:cell shape-determining protein MreD